MSFNPRSEVISIQIEIFRFPKHHLTKVCEPVIHAICMDLRLDQSSCIHLSIEPLLQALGCLDHELFKFQCRVFDTRSQWKRTYTPPPSQGNSTNLSSFRAPRPPLERYYKVMIISGSQLHLTHRAHPWHVQEKTWKIRKTWITRGCDGFHRVFFDW